jgi:C-terminal processing protease CtpA/Prc
VLKVFEDSPAEAAGIKAGDVIVKIGEEEIEEIDDVFEAINEVHVEVFEDEEEEESEVEVTMDNTLSVTVLRKGKTKTFEVELKEDFAMHKEFIIKSPRMEGFKHLEMPMYKEYRIPALEQEELEAKMKALEKEMEKLQKKLEKMEKND